MENENICVWCGQFRATWKIRGREKGKYYHIHYNCIRKLFFEKPLWYLFGIPKGYK